MGAQAWPVLSRAFPLPRLPQGPFAAAQRLPPRRLPDAGGEGSADFAPRADAEAGTGAGQSQRGPRGARRRPALLRPALTCTTLPFPPGGQVAFRRPGLPCCPKEPGVTEPALPAGGSRGSDGWALPLAEPPPRLSGGARSGGAPTAPSVPRGSPRGLGNE